MVCASCSKHFCARRRSDSPLGEIINVPETFENGSIRLVRDVPVGTPTWKRFYHRARNASGYRNSVLEDWELKFLLSDFAFYLLPVLPLPDFFSFLDAPSPSPLPCAFLLRFICLLIPLSASSTPLTLPFLGFCRLSTSIPPFYRPTSTGKSHWSLGKG
jgi:hypothetical protein